MLYEVITDVDGKNGALGPFGEFHETAFPFAVYDAVKVGAGDLSGGKEDNGFFVAECFINLFHALFCQASVERIDGDEEIADLFKGGKDFVGNDLYFLIVADAADHFVITSYSIHYTKLYD